jgi:GxxExxY protein
MAMEVHRVLGPGLLESLYESALRKELEVAGMSCARQVPIPVEYKGEVIGEHRLDLLVEGQVIVEVKAVERFDPVFEAQILSYLRITGKRVGLLVNFHSQLLKNGIKRYVL